MTFEEYFDSVKALRAYLQTDAIVPNSPNSDVYTRFITPDEVNQTDWVGHLRNTTTKIVNVWMISFLGLRSSNENSNAIGTMDKPIDVILDFLYDYRQGTDDSNSEEEFLGRLFKVDWFFENKRHCFPDGVRLLEWRFDIKHKPFSSDSTHWGQGILKFQFDGIILP